MTFMSIKTVLASAIVASGLTMAAIRTTMLHVCAALLFVFANAPAATAKTMYDSGGHGVEVNNCRGNRYQAEAGGAWADMGGGWTCHGGFAGPVTNSKPSVKKIAPKIAPIKGERQD